MYCTCVCCTTYLYNHTLPYQYLYSITNTIIPYNITTPLINLPLSTLYQSIDLLYTQQYYTLYNQLYIYTYGGILFNTGTSLPGQTLPCIITEPTCNINDKTYNNMISGNINRYINGTILYTIDDIHQLLYISFVDMTLQSSNASTTTSMNIILRSNGMVTVQYISHQFDINSLIGLVDTSNTVLLPNKSLLTSNSTLQYCSISNDLCIWPIFIQQSSPNQILSISASQLQCYSQLNHSMLCMIRSTDDMVQYNTTGVYSSTSHTVECSNINTNTINIYNVQLFDIPSQTIIHSTHNLQFIINRTAAMNDTQSYCTTCGIQTHNPGCWSDCAGTINGTAIIDSCGVCTGGHTMRVYDDVLNCQGICYGPNVTQDECTCQYNYLYNISAMNTSNSTMYNPSLQYSTIYTHTAQNYCTALLLSEQMTAPVPIDVVLEVVNPYRYVLLGSTCIALGVLPLYTIMQQRKLRENTLHSNRRTQPLLVNVMSNNNNHNLVNSQPVENGAVG